MKHNTHLRKIIFLAILFFGLSMELGAQTFQFAPHKFTNYLNVGKILSTTTPDTIKVEHNLWANMTTTTNWSNSIGYKIKSVTDIIKFYVYLDTNISATKYTYKVPLEIWGWTNPSDTTAKTIVNDTLVISYNPDSLELFQDKYYLKYSGFHKMYIFIHDIYSYDVAANTLTPLTASEPNINCNIEGEIWMQKFDKSYYGPTGTPTMNNASLNADNTLHLSWSTSGAKEPSYYELEWAYLDDYKMNGLANPTFSDKPASQVQYDFKNDATRIHTEKQSYDIPLVYNKGYIAYRVRMIRPDSVNYFTPVYSNWTVTNAQGTISSIGASNYYKINSSHRNDSTNWQYTISFAEQGKYKNVLSYYDGTLKGRQTLTKFNSVPNKVIATENIYDYEGRPGISILPTPVNQSKLDYISNFANSSTTNKPYNASDFDTLLDICPHDILIPKLTSSSLASVYYSPLNTATDFHKYVPDAEGYPLLQTIYAPEGGKILKQGGAGDTMQIGKGHETKYRYASPMQSEINRYFGTEIGFSEFYNKTVVKDPNGQNVYSVTDFHGKTVATGMLGIADTVTHPVDNIPVPDTVSYKEDLLAGYSQMVMNHTWKLNTAFDADVSGNYGLQYKLQYSPYPICPAENKYLTVRAICNYELFDECGDKKVDVTDTLGTNGIIVQSTAAPLVHNGTYYSPYLLQGVHTVNKTMSIDMSQIYSAIDTFMDSPSTCLLDEPYFIRKAVESKTFPCPIDTLDPCAGLEQIMMNDMWPAIGKYGKYWTPGGVVLGDDTASIFTPYYFATNGQVIAGTFNSSLDTISKSMLGHIIPGTTIPYDSMKYRYQMCDSIIANFPTTIWKGGIAYTNILKMPVDSFIYVFNDEIAKHLLPLHPEYCKLKACHLSADNYDEFLMAIPDHQKAMDMGYYAITQIIQNDPLSPYNNNVVPSDSLKYFKGGKYRIDSLSLAIGYCGGIDTNQIYSCISQYNTPLSTVDIYNAPIDAKRVYFNNLISMYVGNRNTRKQMLMEAMGAGDCNPCALYRMKLKPPPIIPTTGNSSSSGYVADSSSLAELNSYSDNGVVAPSWVVNALANDTIDSWTDDTAQVWYNTQTAIVCDSAVAFICKQFVNCSIDTNVLNAIRDSLKNYYCYSGTPNMHITPDIVRHCLLVNGVSLNDLCNPYLLDYKPIPIPVVNSDRTVCKESLFYDEVKSYLVRSQIKQAMNNPGTSYTISSISTTNSFENSIATILGTTSNVVVSATYDNIKKQYKLTSSNQANTLHVDIWFQNNYTSGNCSLALANLYDWNISQVSCIKGYQPFILDAIINQYSFYTVIQSITQVGSTYDTTYCKYLNWNHKIRMMDTLSQKSGNIINGVSCADLKHQYLQLKDTLSAYGIKYNHPSFERCMTNFLNYNLDKNFIWDDYTDFLSSCAITDTFKIPAMLSQFRVSFNTLADADTFANHLLIISSSLSITPANYTRYTLGGKHIFLIDFNTIPFTQWLAAKNYLSSSSVLNAIEQTSNPYLHNDTLAQVFIPKSNLPFTPAFSVGDFASSTNTTLSTSVPSLVYSSNTAVDTFSVYTVTVSSSIPNYLIARYTDSLINYVYQKSGGAFVLSSYAGLIHPDYYKLQKQDYLNYTYNIPYISRTRNLLHIMEDSLKLNIANYATNMVTYSDPVYSNKFDNLYLSEANQTVYPGYNLLNSIFTKVANTSAAVNGKHTIFFQNNPVTQAMQLQTGGANTHDSLRSYHCGNVTSWMYRYFKTKDTLYTVFVDVPNYIKNPQNYGIHIVQVGEGDGDAFQFTLFMDKLSSAFPGIQSFTCRGTASFAVGKTLELEHVLLTHEIFDELKERNETTCESIRLSDAILEGKIAYLAYRDSVRNAIASLAWDYIENSVHENLYIKTKDQKYQFTLYYYDRAGNLTRTVPPMGVHRLDTLYIDPVNTNRLANTISSTTTAVHDKVSSYKYNSLNQVVYQKIPDGGETYFYYDAVGRIAFSQNDKQKEVPSNLKFSYTLYDDQSRIIETGEVQSQNSSVILNSNTQSIYNVIRDYVISLPRSEVVATVYDNEAIDLGTFTGMSKQTNLRKRVSCVKKFKYMPAHVRGDTCNQYTFASHYSYDILGNVKTITQDFYFMPMHQQRFKRIDYDYDLYSGKVNLVSYNRGGSDEFYQRYAYDEDNRLTSAETSKDGIYWDHDANYTYYQHGPLARQGIGDLHVQATDFAYTLQGWIKAVNSDVLKTTLDIGQDGVNTVYAKDVMSYTLDYYKGDYKAVNAGVSVEHIAPTTKGLFNGNIVRQNTSLLPFPYLSKDYRYDPLNRLSQSHYAVMDTTTYALNATQEYRNAYKYDNDGNILKLVRMGNKNPTTAQLMDSMTYKYNSSNVDNKLLNITDPATANYNGIDIPTFTNAGVTRFLYDKIGNLIKDQVNGNDTILWNLYGKTTHVTNSNGLELDFDYDGAGNRISKTVTTIHGDTTVKNTDYYVRDASGNILSVLKANQQFKKSGPIKVQYDQIIDNPSMDPYINGITNPQVIGSLMDQLQSSSTFTTAMINNGTPTKYMRKSHNLATMLQSSYNYGIALRTSSDSLIQKAVVEYPSDLLFGMLSANKIAFKTAMQKWGEQAPQSFESLKSRLNINDSSLTNCSNKIWDMADTNLSKVLYALQQSYDDSVWMKPTNKKNFIKECIRRTEIFNPDNESNWQLWKSTIANSMENKLNKDSVFAIKLGIYFAGLGLTTLKQYIPAEALLNDVYTEAPDSFYTKCKTIMGSTNINKALYKVGAIPSWYLDQAALDNILPEQQAFPAYSWNLIYDNLYLAEHHLYGSSRLGIKGYLPQQISYTWAEGMPSSIKDSSSINARRSWFSGRYNDFVEQTITEPSLSANMDATHWHSTRMLGQKQYEMTDHLGNVNLTLLDRLRRHERNGVLDDGLAEISNAWDYYPYGMYMPGRVATDTSQHCVDYTLTTFLPSTIKISNWDQINDAETEEGLQFGAFKYYGAMGGTMMRIRQELGLNIISSEESREDAGVTYKINTIQGNSYEAMVDIDMEQAQDVEIYLEAEGFDSEGNSLTIADMRVDGNGTYKIDYEAIGDSTHIKVACRNARGGYNLKMFNLYTYETVYTQGTVTINSCTGEEKYRMGYNTNEKVNEIAGIGDHLTALFGEYDTRLVWRWNRDPKPQDGVSEYSIFLGNPILHNDIDLDKPPKGNSLIATSLLPNTNLGAQVQSIITAFNNFFFAHPTADEVYSADPTPKHDSKGYIRNASARLYKQSPACGYATDFVHLVGEILGLNVIDNYVADVANGNVKTPGDALLKTADLVTTGVSISEGGVPVRGEEIELGAYKDVKNDGHHIIQDKTVEDIPGYKKTEAPVVKLEGPSTAKGTQHNIATSVQRKTKLGGTYGAERVVAYRALRYAGFTEAQARLAISYADRYFKTLGVKANTPTKIPKNRSRK